MTDQSAQPTQRWVRKDHWLRTKDGEWLNARFIKSVSVDEAEKGFCLRLDCGIEAYNLIDGFETKEAAQEHLDKLQIFYELKAI